MDHYNVFRKRAYLVKCIVFCNIKITLRPYVGRDTR